MSDALDNEAVLIRMTQLGSPESFDVLVDRYEQRIYRLCYAITKNAEDAEGVLQETFLKAYANIGHFRKDSQFYTWLFRIAINEALTKLRRRHGPAWVSLDPPVDCDEVPPSPGHTRDWRPNLEESYGANELRAILAKALEDLDTPLRIVFALRDIEGLSTQETARVLRLSIGTVKSRLMSARLKLRKRLSAWFGYRPVLAPK